MYIKGNSGIIYPETGTNVSLNSDLASLATSSVLYGNNSDLGTNSQIAKSGTIFGDNTDNSLAQSDTSIEQTTPIHIEEDIDSKLEEYRRRLSEWKDRDTNVKLVDSFGLDMNSDTKNSTNDTEKEKQTPVNVRR